ncbi:MAG: hypothetical protein AAF585_24675, partial [Verrucomicrobiota bacterium]
MLDVNNTRYHLLLGASDWNPLLGDDLEWLDDDEAVALEKTPFVFPDRSEDERVETTDRRGAGSDIYGALFWIGEDQTQIWTRPASGDARLYWPVEDPGQAACEAAAGEFQPKSKQPASAEESQAFRGLAITDHHYLIVGVSGSESGLLVFDLHGGGSPQFYAWPTEIGPFDPKILSARRGGGLLVVESTRLWKLTRWFRVEGREASPLENDAGDFAPKDGSDSNAKIEGSPQ